SHSVSNREVQVSEGEFLGSREDVRPWVLPNDAPAGFRPLGLYLGQGNSPLEVAVATARRPTVTQVRQLWHSRHGNTPSPLLLIVLSPGPDSETAGVCGPVQPSPAAVMGLPREQ